MKKISIKKYIPSLIAAIIIIFTIYVSNRIYNASFEQYIYSLLKSQGTSSTSLVNGIFYIGIGVLILFPLLILPIIDFNKSITIKFKIKGEKKERQILPIKNIKKYNIVIIIISIFYLAYGIGFFEFIKNSLMETDLFKKYYVTSENVQIEFPDNKKNLIYIFLESTETTNFSEKNGGIFEESIMPNLEKLALNNINFSNTNLLGGAQESYGTGWTVAAMIAQTSGIPLKIKANDYDVSSTNFNNITTIGDILEENGYNNYLLLGSDANFGGRKNYFNNHGYEISDYHTAVEAGKIDEDYFVWWGYEDSKLFEYAKEKILEISKEDEPFNLTMLTADTHFTDGYLDSSCNEVFEEDYANSFYCSDSMIYDFINWIKEQEFYEDTVIILVGDHPTMQQNFYEIEEGYTRTVFNTFINTGIKTANNKNRTFTTMDMFPTTLAALGAQIEGNRLGLGTNLFSDKKTIPEEIGIEKFNEELKKQSDYYYDYIRG